jgi:tetrathionate reductase subunit B
MKADGGRREAGGGGRRAWLGAAAAGLAGVMLAPGVRLVEVATAATLRRRPGRQPRGALGPADRHHEVRRRLHRLRHRLPHRKRPAPTPQRSTDARWIRKIEIKEVKTGRQASAPVMCQHCAEPPCVDVCPTGASFKRADGIVLVDRHSCIGCRYCMMACPYKARSFVHEELSDQLPDVPRGKGCVESCTLCVHRIDRGDKTTACAEACAKAGHGAIVFGDLNDPGSEIARRVREIRTTQLRADLRLDPGVRYQGL